MLDKPTGKKLRNYFINHCQSIAVAESVTSGNLQAIFSQVKDAAKFFQGGITTYNIGQKYKHLNVDPIHAIACDCVSLQVAENMSLNVCKLFNSDWELE